MRRFASPMQPCTQGTKRQTGSVRKRQGGGGRKGQLGTTEQKLLFSLVYLKTYPLQALLGESVWAEPVACEPVVAAVAADSAASAWTSWACCRAASRSSLPSRNGSHQETAELIIDGTERRRQRPKNQAKQALHYSGKQKTHSDKNVVVVNAKTKRVGYLSQTYAGKMHDKKIVDTEPIRYPPGTILYKDTGFQGYEPKVQQTHQPKKSRAKAR